MEYSELISTFFDLAFPYTSLICVFLGSDAKSRCIHSCSVDCPAYPAMSLSLQLRPSGKGKPNQALFDGWSALVTICTFAGFDEGCRWCGVVRRPTLGPPVSSLARPDKRIWVSRSSPEHKCYGMASTTKTNPKATPNFANPNHSDTFAHSSFHVAGLLGFACLSLSPLS
jgi:hypothetical protein